MSEPAPLEYAVFGVLCAARVETGPKGACRLYRIQQRIDNWDNKAVAQALYSLMERGWVCQLEPILGMVHYEIATDHVSA